MLNFKIFLRDLPFFSFFQPDLQYSILHFPLPITKKNKGKLQFSYRKKPSSPKKTFLPPPFFLRKTKKNPTVTNFKCLTLIRPLSQQMAMEQNRSAPMSVLSSVKVIRKPSILEVGEYLVGSTLGEGSFGKVKIGIHKATKQEVSFKKKTRTSSC